MWPPLESSLPTTEESGGYTASVSITDYPSSCGRSIYQRGTPRSPPYPPHPFPPHAQRTTDGRRSLTWAGQAGAGGEGNHGGRTIHSSYTAGGPLPSGLDRTDSCHVTGAPGGPAYPMYSLRHTAATLLLRAGINPKVTSERLGHSSVAFTMDVYSASLPDMQEEAAEKMEAMFGTA